METLNPNILSEKFKLAKNESKIFFELLRLGNSPIGKIIKQTKLHRGSVYNSIQRLSEKGLVSSKKTENGVIYIASHFGLLKEIDEEEKHLEEKRKTINEILKWMKIEKEIDSSEEKIEYFVGDNAFKGFWFDLLEKCRNKEENYLFIGTGDGIMKKMTLPYYKYQQNIKVNMGVKCKVIQNEEILKSASGQYIRGKIKFLPKTFNYPTMTWLYDNKCVIVDWDKNPTNILLIENKNLAESYKNIFKILWKQKAVKATEVYAPIKD